MTSAGRVSPSPHRGLRCRCRKYKISCAEYEDLRASAEGKCQICGKPEHEELYGVLCIDHVFGADGSWLVRGLLCNRCNSALDQPVMAGPARDRYLANPWHAVRMAHQRA